MITRYNDYNQEIVTEQLFLHIKLLHLCNYSLSQMNSNFSNLNHILIKTLKLPYKKKKGIFKKILIESYQRTKKKMKNLFKIFYK